MNAEELLNFIEGTTAISDAITTVRDQLIERGWTVHGAEQVAIIMFGLMTAASSPAGATS